MHFLSNRLNVCLNLPALILASLWLPVLAFGLRYVEATQLALLLKLGVVGAFALIISVRLRYSWWLTVLLAGLGGLWFWGGVLHGWMVASVAFLAGAFAYVVLLYPLADIRFLHVNEKKFVWHACAVLALLLLMGLLLGQGYRLVYPFADPNMTGFMLASV